MSDANGTIERKALIFNTQKYNVYDGPGIRTLIFFKGCPLRCKWCANPEGMEHRIQVLFKQDLCVDCGTCVKNCPVGIQKMSTETGHHVVDRSIQCIGCRKCEEACPTKALSIMGQEMSISELLDIAKEDKMFYESSGGGVTLGGGEVLMQPDAAASLLQACKQSGINTAIETCGYAKKEDILKVAEFVDLFLFDIKHIDPETHSKLTGVRNERILDNLQELLHRRFNVKIRMPLLKGVNDGQEEIEKVIEFLMPYKDCKNFHGIDLLPYHKLGVAKYKQLAKDYPIEGDPSLSQEDLDRIEGWIKKYDFPVKVIKH